MKDKDLLHWSQLDIKTKIAYLTAIVAFCIGWGLTIVGFIIGAGVISDSVLWVLGQALIYAASVFGVGLYITGSVKAMKTSLRQFMTDEKRILESEETIDENDEVS